MRISEIPTPAYVVDEAKLKKNLEILKSVQEHTGCKILLAQKAFSMFCEYPLIGRYLSGTTASGLYEARLGYEEMGKENHIFSPAYRVDEIDEIADICDHVTFNSFSQLRRFGPRCSRKASIGLRINPECSTQGKPTGSTGAVSPPGSEPVNTGGEGLHPVYPSIYDPCAPGSRLGITQKNFERELSAWHGFADGAEEYAAAGWNCGKGENSAFNAHCTEFFPECVEGLHFHTLCEQNSDDLEITLKEVERRFGPYLKRVKWLNMGGGHHITRADYDLERLERCICHMQKTYDLDIYLEPGEAVALNAGYLVTEVMDMVENGGVTTLILDASAACHMPDVLEMPYRPPLYGSGQPGEKPYTYRLSSCTCLAGDIIGDYSFDHEIHPGDRLYFEDMAIYSMVKNNTFNGMALPSIWVLEEPDGSAGFGKIGMVADTAGFRGKESEDGSAKSGEAELPRGECRLIKKFSYEDFKGRLS